MYSYIDLLALIGVGSAHPGGFALTKYLLQYIPIHSTACVLDAGCGTGRTAAYIAKTYSCSVTGIDSHPVMLQKAEKRMNKEGVAVKLVHGSVEQMPFASQSFSHVMSESVIAFTNINKTLGELRRVLKPDGTAVLLEMTVERPLSMQEKEDIGSLYGTKEILTEEEWMRKLLEAGFSHTETIGGGTIDKQMHLYADLPDWDLSPQVDPSVYTVWAQHEAIIRMYGHLLGYRVFLCKP